MSEQRRHELEEDLALVNRAKTGDQGAFAQLMQRYQQRAFAVAMGVLRSRDDALDVVQDSFIKVHKNLDGFQGQSSFYTWLYRIVVNGCIDARRKHARARVEPLPEHGAEDEHKASQLGVSPLRPGGAPGQNLLDRELGAHIQTALARLTENHRTILVLREVDGLSYEELADLLQISKGTVMSRLFHARQNMQRELRPFLGLADGEGLPGPRAPHSDTDPEVKKT